MSWTKVLSVDSLVPGARQVVKVGENSILLINNNGQFHAVGNLCPHLKLSMTKGKITEDGAIVCLPGPLWLTKRWRQFLNPKLYPFIPFASKTAASG